jgi:hypothetical protein
MSFPAFLESNRTVEVVTFQGWVLFGNSPMDFPDGYSLAAKLPSPYCRGLEKRMIDGSNHSYKL